ncbi:MAG: PEP-CTERM sorting domain-containing protein [Phycisphaerales bacterium]
MKISYVAALSLCSGLALAGGSNILAIDSNTDQVLLLDGFDGSIINSSFLDVASAASAAGTSSTPIECIQVGNEFWVSDQIADRVWRFGSDGSFIGDIGSGQLNNIRGMHQVGNTVFVAMGSDSDLYDRGIITIDATTASITGQFNGRDPADTSYWDITQVGNELYVTNSDTGNDGIERYSLEGDYLGNLVSSDGVTGLDFGQQMFIRDNGNILVGGFSSPSGVWEYLADGTSLGIVAGLDLGTRAAIDLGNGEILWSNGSFLATDSYTVADGSFRFFTATNVPAPASLAILGLGGLAASRRKR